MSIKLGSGHALPPSNIFTASPAFLGGGPLPYEIVFGANVHPKC